MKLLWVLGIALSLISNYITLATGKKGDAAHNRESDNKNGTVAKLNDLVKSFIYGKEITLSGHAIGGGFAQIIHLAHSNLFTGIGLFASPFYKCGGYSQDVQLWYSKCGIPGNFPIGVYETDLEGADIFNSIQTLKQYEKDGLVAPLTNLEDQKLYQWKGSVDEYWSLNVSLSVVNIYEPLFKTPSQIHTVVQYGGHYVPTVSSGNTCPDRTGVLGPNTTALFIGKCNYNGAYEMLNFLLSDPGYRLARSNKPKLQPLLKFSQSEFFEGIPEPIGLDDTGYIYIPKRCQRPVTTCHLHFYFHTCFAASDYAGVGTLHIKGTGLLEEAEENGIIIVFPQAKTTSFNKEACFDAFGYTGKDFANKNGKQRGATSCSNNKTELIIPPPDS